MQGYQRGRQRERTSARERERENGREGGRARERERERGRKREREREQGRKGGRERERERARERKRERERVGVSARACVCVRAHAYKIYQSQCQSNGHGSPIQNFPSNVSELLQSCGRTCCCFTKKCGQKWPRLPLSQLFSLGLKQTPPLIARALTCPESGQNWYWGRRGRTCP